MVLHGLAFLCGAMMAWCDRIVALAHVVGPICHDPSDLLVSRDLTKKIGQHRCIADVAAGNIDGPDLRCFLVKGSRSRDSWPATGPRNHGERTVRHRHACAHATHLLQNHRAGADPAGHTAFLPAGRKRRRQIHRRVP